ncbi:MAG TPA: class I SAM-dependent methyltransferase [Usitatibacter sp.]|jgi:SAM-dependent methyltransferase|nr:class I SAM-dependent methyltransferase [Usitatibacter sp.]
MDSIYTDGTYLARNPAWHSADSGWKADRVARILERHGIVPKTVCEVGCGAGGVIAGVAQRWPGARCVDDVSPHAWALSSRKSAHGLEYRLGDALAEAERFDVALAIDVVEHVEDSPGFLRRLRPKAAHTVFHIPPELSATELGRYGWKSRLLNGPRRALFAIDPDAAARLLGGYSVLVLAA